MFKRTSLMLAGLALAAINGTAAAGVQFDVNIGIGIPGVAVQAPAVVYQPVPVYRPVPVYVERHDHRFHRYGPRPRYDSYRHGRRFHDYR